MSTRSRVPHNPALRPARRSGGFSWSAARQWQGGSRIPPAFFIAGCFGGRCPLVNCNCLQFLHGGNARLPVVRAVRVTILHSIEMKPIGRPMIQDRLTAKFQSAKPAVKRETRPQPTTTPKTKHAAKPATDRYTVGRTLAASFWL